VKWIECVKGQMCCGRCVFVSMSVYIPSLLYIERGGTGQAVSFLNRSILKREENKKRGEIQNRREQLVK